MEHVAVGGFTQRAVAPDQVVNAVYALNVHGQTFQTVGDLTGNRFTFQTTNLLEVSELRHFHAVQPHFPAQSPGTQRQRYILRIRTLTKAVAEAYYASREALGFPMCNKDK